MWKRLVWFAGPMALLLAATVGSSQQKVPFDKGIPVAPSGLAHRPMPKLPMEFDTAEGQRIRVVSVEVTLHALCHVQREVSFHEPVRAQGTVRRRASDVFVTAVAGINHCTQCSFAHRHCLL